MKTKIDKTYIGAILGTILPILAFLAFWMYKNEDVSLTSYVNTLMQYKAYRNDPLVFSLIPNLVVFYFSNFQFKLLKFTVGLVAATLAYAIPIVISLI
jgi:hypothetical protein